MIESQSADQSADRGAGLECRTMRIYARLLSHHERRSISWRTDVLPFAAMRRSRLVEFLHYTQETPFSKIHWLLYISKTLAQYDASSLPGIASLGSGTSIRTLSVLNLLDWP
jgi:hypothetical protein